MSKVIGALVFLKEGVRTVWEFIRLLALAAPIGVYAWVIFGPWIQPLFGASSTIAGRASVIDGDTISIHGQRIRLYGIDAPESRQVCYDGNRHGYRCGQLATRALSNKIGGRRVSCDQRDIDRYGRIVAVCQADGENLNGWLVREGLAVAYMRYSWRYVPAEIGARFSRSGIWAGNFIKPETWRRQNR